MSDEQTVDTLAGLSVVENELERALDELDKMYGRLNIHLLEWVSLWPLKWALGKLADDLHEADAELRSLRLAVSSARSEAEEARKGRMNEQLQSLSIFNGLRAELDAANEQHAIVSRKYDAEVERRLALEKQVAELTEKLGELPDEEDEPFPEPYHWQVGDEIVREDGTIHIITRTGGGLLWFKNETLGASAQWWLVENGYRLHRKASADATDLFDIPPFTTQQVAEFAAAMEQVSDSVGTDGEGQS